MNKCFLVLAALLASTLSACGSTPDPYAAPPQSESAAPVAQANVPQLASAGAAIPVDVVSTGDTSGSGGAANDVIVDEPEPDPESAPAVAAARHAFALEKGVDDAEVKVLEVENVDWPDRSLGCPTGDQDYPQVITPGYRVLLEAKDERAEYHTSDGDDPQIVRCRGLLVGASRPEVPTREIPAVKAVIRDYAAAMGATDEEVKVVEAERASWPDSSMGCPRPDQMYLPVITPGYRVVVSVTGQQDEYHTSDGESPVIVRCDSPVLIEGSKP